MRQGSELFVAKARFPEVFPECASRNKPLVVLWRVTAMLDAQETILEMCDPQSDVIIVGRRMDGGGTDVENPSIMDLAAGVRGSRSIITSGHSNRERAECGLLPNGIISMSVLHNPRWQWPLL